MYSILVIFVLSWTSCNGFLFDDVTTPRPNSGSSLTDKHYFALVDMVMQEKQLRESYMLQIKQKILENEHKASVLESKVDKLYSGNDTVVDKTDFDKVTHDLMQKYQTLDGNYKSLQQSFIALQQNYAFIMDENNKLKSEINSSGVELNQMKLELNELKALKSINELQEIQNLKHENSMVKQELQTTNTRINGLVSTQQARGQDFLALYNRTVNMKTQTQVFKEEAEKSDVQIENKIQQIQKDHNESVVEIQQSIHNISKDKERLENELKQANNRISDNSKKVAVTACVVSYRNVHQSVAIPFSSIVTANGINNLQSLQNKGVFICVNPGLYIVSVTIMSTRYNGFFRVFNNDNHLVTAYMQNKESNTYYSGTAITAVEMKVGDKISVKPFSDNSLINGTSLLRTSCLTIVKVK